MHERPKKTSVIIAEIVEDCVEDSVVTVEEFLGKMGHRAIAIAILVFGISAVIAGVVPGFSTLVAVPIIFMAFQMVLGRSTVRLPKKIREKQISPKIIRGALAQAIPALRGIEKFLKPRLLFMTHPLVERLIALVICVLAGILALPIPGGNFLPSFGITILALAMLERDGLLLAIAVGLIYFTGGLMIDLIVAAYQYTVTVVQGMF